MASWFKQKENQDITPGIDLLPGHCDLQVKHGARIQLMRCDITKVEADVCVTSVHRSKDMNKSCLGNQFLKACGQGVQVELYRKEPREELKFGQVEMTSPGKMKNFKELMFICLYIYREGNEDILQQSIIECLELAAVKGFKTVALPGLGLGQGYPPKAVAAIMVEAVALHNLGYPHTPLEEVKIVLFDQQMEIIQAFLEICASGSPKGDVTDLMTVASVQEEGDICDGSNSSNSKARIQSQQKGSQASPRTDTQGTQGGAVQGYSGVLAGFLSSFFLKKIFTCNFGPLCFSVKPQIQGRTKVGLQLNVTVDIFFFANFVPDNLKAFFKKNFK